MTKSIKMKGGFTEWFQSAKDTIDNSQKTLNEYHDKAKKGLDTMHTHVKNANESAKKLKQSAVDLAGVATRGTNQAQSAYTSAQSTYSPSSVPVPQSPVPQFNADPNSVPTPVTVNNQIPSGGKKMNKKNKKGGSYKDNISSTNLAAHAASIDILTAQPQGWYGGKKYRKGSRSKTHKGRLNFTTKKGSKVYHRKGHYIRKSRKPYTMGGKKYRKGSRSKTHKGRLNFTTKKGSKVYHRKGHYIRKSRKPYTHKRRY